MQLRRLQRSIFAAALAMGIATAGCASGDSVCAAAADKIAECTGSEVADVGATCDPATASQILELDCEQISADIDGEKNDGGALSGPFYVVLFASADKYEAEARAAEIVEAGQSAFVIPHVDGAGKSGFLVVWQSCPLPSLDAILAASALRNDFDGVFLLKPASPVAGCETDSAGEPSFVLLYEPADDADARAKLAEIQALDQRFESAVIERDLIGNLRIFHDTCPLTGDEAFELGSVAAAYGLVGDVVIRGSWRQWENMGCPLP